MDELKGSVVVVLGGSGGIGSEVARAFHGEGARVSVGYLTNRPVALREEIGGFIDKVDLRESVGPFLSQVKRDHSRLDHVVIAAGIHGKVEFPEVTESQLEEMFRVNALGTFRAIQSACSIMGEGTITTISSVGAYGGIEAPHYAASKAAVIAMTKSAALNYAPRIRVNCLVPGQIETPMTPEADLSKIPMGRIGTPKDVAHAAIFLAENTFVTGETLHVDGGFLL